jgi:hypothetical protein
LITAVTTNTFDVTVANSGSFGGTTARYTLGFNYTHLGSPATGGQLTAPTNGEVQLLSMKVRTGTRSGSTYDVFVPASITNGAGANTNLGNSYIPSFSVRDDSTTLAAIAGTIAVNNLGAGYSTFTFGNLGSGSLSRFIILQF